MFNRLETTNFQHNELEHIHNYFDHSELSNSNREVAVKKCLKALITVQLMQLYRTYGFDGQFLIFY